MLRRYLVRFGLKTTVVPGVAVRGVGRGVVARTFTRFLDVTGGCADLAVSAMKRSNFSKCCLVAILAIVSLANSASAQSNGNSRTSVTVSFGAGLNTAQPGNAANHHILPMTIEIKAGGVVNFAVAGFHQIFVYNPGKRPEDVFLPGGTPLFIDDLDGLYYQGIVPGEDRSAHR